MPNFLLGFGFVQLLRVTAIIAKQKTRKKENMSLFQKSVTNKYIKNLDTENVDKAFDNFQKFYGNKTRLANIMQLKEENYQEGFLREIFVETLGYIINPDENFNLTTEYKNQKDARKADGAILKDGKAIGVIELKSTKTKNLESIKEQAFGYKNNQPDCKYVITSNFQSLRFYVDNATEYEEFNLFQLNKEQFKLLYLLLSKESVFSDLPEKLKQETKFHENKISTQLYADYKRFKDKIFENLIKNNTEYDKLTLFKKSQKLLDRFLFIFFAEDSGLIPPNAVSKIVEQWKGFIEEDEYFTLYSRFQKLFTHLDSGHTYKKWGRIPAYNGGLFRNDEILDSSDIKIDDEILEKDSLKLSAYDFNSEVDVNILGHIFEHSLNEIEEITAELHGGKLDKKKSKRKKDGVFYTPKYITKYIVENTVGKLCKEKKAELQINNLLIDENYRKKDGKINENGKKLFKTLNDYKDWLIALKILDPACGSGAFLNQTLDFLIAEHKQVDDLIAELTGDAIRMFDTDKAILENNIYGVDINEESVEIAKLSLWLRTAQKGRKLSDLSGNIKCGNSLIDDPEVAGDKAFDWDVEFPQIFKEKEKSTWHITTATHNSRYSQRMFDNYVKLDEAVWISEEEELIISETIAEIAKTDNINIPACNICGDHLHMILVCEEKEMTKIVGKIKAMTARACNIAMGRTATTFATTRGHAPLSDTNTDTKRKRGKTQNSLWTQKFGKKRINDNEYYNNTLNYIRNNKTKHKLPENKKLQKTIDSFVCTTKHAFRKEYNGGFDVVLGNPPYVQIIDYKKQYDKIYVSAKSGDLYALFFEKGIKLLKNNGLLGFITPSSYMTNIGFLSLRKYLLNYNIKNLFDLGGNVFNDASVDSAIIVVEKNYSENNIALKGTNLGGFSTIEQKVFKKLDNLIFNIYANKLALNLADKLKVNNQIFGDYLNFARGVEFGFKSDKVFNEKVDVDSVPLICGGNISKHNISFNNKYINHNANDTKIYKSTDIYEKEKILIKRIGNSIIGAYDNSGFYNVCDVYNLQLKKNDNYKLIVLSMVINSKLLNFYYDTKFKSVKKLFPKIPIQNLKLLPLPKFSNENQQPFIIKADLMLSLNKERQSKSEKFIKRIKSNLEIEKITYKLNNFYDFDFKTFVSELKKQKVKLNLSQQDEWEDYFDNYKTEINNIQNKINQTDKEIDKMVYELYELTDEEIEIVENSVG